jgi:hypothetical protein
MTITRVLAIILVSFVSLVAQGSDKTLRGTVSIKASGGHTVAVSGKADTDFLFCIDLDRAAPAQRIDFTGPARVLYRPAPVPGLPEGVKINGPEMIANTLAVVTDDGKAWVFAATDQKPLTDKALGQATKVGATVVRRLDWTTGSGPRRGTDVAGCLAPAG